MSDCIECQKKQAQVDLMVLLNQRAVDIDRENDKLKLENDKLRYVLEQIHQSTQRFCGSNERRLRRLIERVLDGTAD